ncbi:MAG: protoglobin domain-containing protein [Planctomycetota bacterium]
MAETFFSEIKRFVGFDDHDSHRLAALAARIAPHIGPITDLFYATLLKHEGARSVLTDGERQIERLKVSLAEWLRSLFQGPHDEQYFAKRWEIGRAHVRIRLPEKYVFAAMNLVRIKLLDLLEELEADRELRRLARRSIERILDIELCIITESYRNDYVEQITRQNRLAAIGQLAASLNHELRNPLSVVGSSVYAMRRILEKAGSRTEIERHLEKIDRNLKRTSQIANDLLDFAKGRAPEKKPVNARELVLEALQVAALPAAITREVVMPADLPPILVDRGQMLQVLLNLIENAADAMRGAGRLTIAAKTEGDQVIVEVSDQGCGMTPEQLCRIFEPLYTTKMQGTGLGLPIARNIAIAHGGTITVDSAPGKGATFRIHLPMTGVANKA